MATASLRNIASALTGVLENVLQFKPTLEVLLSHSGQLMFREDLTYYVNLNGADIGYNPFIDNVIPDNDIQCNESPLFCYPAKRLATNLPGANFDTMINPIFYQLIADYINVELNQDQLWINKFCPCSTNVLQNYVSLEKLVQTMVPELWGDFIGLQHEINLERTEFFERIQASKMQNLEFVTPQRALEIYEARGKQYENSVTQDFWDRNEIQTALRELRAHMGRVIFALFPAVHVAAERAAHPSYGYDVFHAFVLDDKQLVVKNLGDYRILHWELKQ